MTEDVKMAALFAALPSAEEVERLATEQAAAWWGGLHVTRVTFDGGFKFTSVDPENWTLPEGNGND